MRPGRPPSGAAVTNRQDPPRSRRILRLIALERAVRGLLLLAAGGYLISHLGSDFGRVADHLMRDLELDPRRPFLHRLIVKLHRLHARTLLITGIGAIGYGLLESWRASASGSTSSGPNT